MFCKSAPFHDRSASAARDGIHSKVFSLNNELRNSTESRATFRKARTPLTWSTVFYTQLTCETLWLLLIVLAARFISTDPVHYRGPVGVWIPNLTFPYIYILMGVFLIG